MLTQNRDLSGWCHVLSRGQLCQYASTITIQLLKRVGLVHRGLHHRHLIEI